MNYRDTTEYLFSRLPVYQRIGKAAYKDDLSTSLAIDEWFGHPHRHYSTIHIAGTNGKGSVSHMMASVLQGTGFKTGLYTSPHLKDFRERIRIDGEMIPEEAVVEFVERYREIVDLFSPSFFEMTAAMAFKWFSDCGVDIAVVETGMGGRLDSTNVVTPLLSVITNIGDDHAEFLGDTQQKRAAEKAGIIKPGIPVVIGSSSADTDPVFLEFAARANAPISFADREYSCRMAPFVPSLAALREYILTRLSSGDVIRGTTPLAGDYQTKNIATLFQAFDLIDNRYRPSADQVVAGVESVVERTGMLGRWQLLGEKPLIICDTAHNSEGLTMVLGQLNSIPHQKLHMVVGFVNDKSLDSVLPLFPTNATYYFTRASIPRALDEKVLQNTALNYGLTGCSYPSVMEAQSAAILNATPGDLIFIGGSTFVVADALLNE